MNFIEQVAKWVGFDVNSPARQDLIVMRDALDEGRRYKRSEAYAKALAAFDRAEEAAERLTDTSALAIVNLHRADVYIKQGQYEEAEKLLSRLRAEAETNRQHIQVSYIFSAFGTLEQTRGNLSGARVFFERALQQAKESQSLGAEGRASGHLADVYLAEGNAAYAVHLLRDTLPKLERSGDIELSSYFVGRLAEAYIATGQTQEGEALLHRALRLAEHMRYQQFERIWNLANGRFALSQGRYHDARGYFERALALFPSDDAELPDVLREMSRVFLTIGQGEKALEYARRAVSLAESNPQNQAALGAALREAQEYIEALPYLEYAAEHDPQPETLRHLAAVQLATGYTEDAEATYERTLALTRNHADPLEAARTQRDFGHFYAKQGKRNDAIKAWSAALDLYIVHDQHAQVARLYCDIANMRMYMGQGVRAMKDYEQALMVLSSANSPETRGLVLANAATAYVDQGDIETAEAFFSEAIKIAQKLNDRTAEATRRGNYGWFLWAVGRYTRALSALEYALKLSQELGLTLQIAIQTDNMGLVYAEMGELDRAITHHRKALALFQTVNNPYWLAVGKGNLASALLKTGEPDALAEAVPLFEDALATGRTIESADVMIRALTGQAKMALSHDDLEVADTLIREAVLLARRANIRRLLAEALLVHGERNARAGNASRALELWEEARKLFFVLQHPAAQTPPAWVGELK